MELELKDIVYYKCSSCKARFQAKNNENISCPVCFSMLYKKLKCKDCEHGELIIKEKTRLHSIFCNKFFRFRYESDTCPTKR